MTQSVYSGFDNHFYTVVKCNFPQLSYTSRLFSDKGEKENPLYYFKTAIEMDDSFIKYQLLIALKICFNHFHIIPPIQKTGIKGWDNFANTAHSEPVPEEAPH